MLRVSGPDYLQVSLGVDFQDLAELRRELLVLSSAQPELHRRCRYSPRLFRGDRDEVQGTLTIRLAEPERIERTDDGLRFDLDEDSISYLAHQLASLEAGARISPEVCELELVRRRKTVTLVVGVNRPEQPQQAPMTRETLELYVACSERTQLMALRFLDHFLPERVPVAEDYPYPELVDRPDAVYTSVDPLFERLEAAPDQGYAVYFSRPESGEPHQGILVFTADGGLIAGLAATLTQAGHRALLEEMASVVGGTDGYADGEGRPPDTLPTFHARCQSAGLRLPHD